jgi:hypothetical protein
MIEVVLNDRLGKKIRVKCNEDDTIGDLKKLVAAQTGEEGLLAVDTCQWLAFMPNYSYATTRHRTPR